MQIRVFTKENPISDKLFEEFYALMEVSFPECERKTREEFKNLCKANSLYKIYAAFEDEELIGFFTVWEFEGFTFGDHFAVSPKKRNMGIGSIILKHIQQTSALPLIIEVEHPIEEMAIKRLGFYLRNGFKQNDFDYLLPPMRDGDSPLPMLILSYPNLLKADDFEKHRSLIYKEVYNGFTI